LVTETEFELFPKDNQIETLFIGGRHIPDYLILLSAIESHCDTIGYPAHFRCAELIYPQAMQAVFRHHKNPLPHSEFKFYGLAQIGTSLAESTPPLRPLILDCLSEKLSQQFTNNFEIIFANSRRDHAYFMALREYVSDAARAACKVRGETPVPFDVSCQINDLPRVLTHLDRLTQRFRQNGFGHLRQGDGTSATFHYNLGVSHTDSDRLPAIEANVLTSLYQEFGGVSHSGEHGGLGSKTLPITVQYCSPAQLDYFQTQLNTYNPHSTLQSSRIERFKELRRTTRT